jgi:acetyltransferase-like isoleucine patch superfamily enzyme
MSMTARPIAAERLPEARASGAQEAPSTRRDVTDHMGGAPNAHRYWYAARREEGQLLSALRISRNYLLISAAKHLPSLWLKRQLFRAIGMKLGHNVTIASGAMLDYFFPELIEIGDNTIVGMDAMILTHEFLHDRFRSGPVRIGKNVLVGANATVLAGVKIGDGATVSAGSLVNRHVAEHSRVGGHPARPLQP